VSGQAGTSDSALVDAIELDVTSGDYPELSRVLAYWHRQRRDRFAPARADIDPADLVESLSLQAHYEEAVRRRTPMLHLILLSAPDQARSYVRLLMPLSEDGATVTMLMTVDSKQQNTKALRDYFQQAVEGRR